MSQGERTNSTKKVSRFIFIITSVKTMFLFIFFHIELHNTGALSTQIALLHVQWDTKMSDLNNNNSYLERT